MRLALSTNWNNRRLTDGSAIVDEALALGFDALELGFCTQPEQLPGFRARRDEMPVDSVHAYCPVPVGAPSGHPELYRLASRDEDERALARVWLLKSLACAAEFGAKTVVTHAGYVDLDGWFRNVGTDVMRILARGPDGALDPQRPAYRRVLAQAKKRRRARGRKMLDVFSRELEILLPDFEKAGVTLALENLPRLEGFPDADEAEALMKTFAGAPLKVWFDTGHAAVRANMGWTEPVMDVVRRLSAHIGGMHLNDVRDFHDDHRQPGWGTVDFAALKPLASGDILRVFEPHEPVSFGELQQGIALIRALWSAPEETARA